MPGNDQRGFTLLEVLIALVIAVLALGLLFSGALAGLRSTALSAHYAQAVSRANSHLAVVGHGGAIIPGDQSGDDGGGFRWRTRIAPAENAPATFGEIDATLAPRVVLYDVTVAVSWAMDGGVRAVTIRSQRVGLVAAPAP